MITRIDYSIRFPFGAEFSKSPKYLFIQAIYRSIKEATCLSDGNCDKCHSVNSCIYYEVCGYNFNEYSGILVNNNYLEKTLYKRSEKMNISFYLIGKISLLKGFIDDFFNSREYIKGIYFQKTRENEIIIDEKEVYDGKILFNSPVLADCNLDEMLKFYNSEYDCCFNKDIQFVELNKIISKDKKQYYLNGNKIVLAGYMGSFKVTNFPKVLLEIGIGKSNVIGGGRSSICE